ncbi:hypothetical protein [Motilimonas cestriensis]|uniref:hypothetical protein n=1 Tax=Motilimonas cestriensis TaxID=2742685 RepID=UPI003DA50F3A
MISDDAKAHLHKQLVKLGDMMGDGLHHESDGKWIKAEYRRTLKALGLLPKAKRNIAGIDAAMAKRVSEVNCQKCGGQLKQTRSGSKRAQCQCGAKYQLLK